MSPDSVAGVIRKGSLAAHHPVRKGPESKPVGLGWTTIVSNQSTLLKDDAVAAESLSDPAWIRIRDLIYQVSGIYQAENKFYLLVSRATRRMKVVGARTPREYLDFLTARPNRNSEMRNLLNEITIGETCLFRSMPQIDALRKVVIPSLAEAKKKMAFTKLRFWSAGCSTGEEPYTLAMIMLEETQALLKGWTFEVMATDLNDRSVAKAQEGVYNDYAVRNVPPEFMKKYFTKVGTNFRVADSVKAHITFSRLNMLDNSKMLFMRGLDVIFCCNILIYFDGISKTRTIQHFFNALLPNGYFFLGHSESLFGISEKFRLVHFPGATAYWKSTEATSKAGTS
jgi:chemotaxis protein methyltransferase CheR